jgi:crossover junction endodeoxyribonuclease RuvC
MIVLGIDPGTRHLGWGVIRIEGTRLSHVAHGVIDTDTTEGIATRLCQIERELVEVVLAHRPDAAAVESLFFAKDAMAAAKLGHARGVVLLVLARRGLPIAEYEPARVKKAVAGHGRADKRQMAMMIAAILRLPEPPRPDAADALAIAFVHAQAAPIAAHMERVQSSLRSNFVRGKRGR